MEGAGMKATGRNSVGMKATRRNSVGMEAAGTGDGRMEGTGRGSIGMEGAAGSGGLGTEDVHPQILFYFIKRLHKLLVLTKQLFP